MAQIKFEDIQDANFASSNQNFAVGFFNLRNDGDEAVVRIMHDNTDSFDIVSTHAINVGGRYRRVNCCRNPHDPIEACPLCESGNPSQQRFYVHLIQYTRDENGQVVPEAKVWERSLAYATTIKNLIVEYGPLSNTLFKIKRNGAAGSMDTTYSIMYANPQMYPENIYPPVPSAFDNYTAIGNAVIDRPVADIAYFVANGSFPQVEQSGRTTTGIGQVAPTPAPTIVAAPPTNPFRSGTSFQNTNGSTNGVAAARPTRYY